MRPIPAVLALTLAAPTLAALPAHAEALLTGEAFQAYIARDTITYGYSTGAEGTADYGPDRTLRWAFKGQPCIDGIWFPRGDEICFAFEDGALSACWHLTLGPDGLQGTATELASGSHDPLAIFETGRSTDPLSCPAPLVGV